MSDPFEIENKKIKGVNFFLVEISIPHTNDEGNNSAEIYRDLLNRLPAYIKIQKVTKIKDWVKPN